MTGLIWKDILVMRKTLKTYVLFLGFYLLLAVLGMFDLSFVTAMINVIVMMLPIGAFSYDEIAKWDRYAMTLPISRRTIVGARYLFVLLMALGAAAFGLLACVLLSMAKGANLTEYLATILVSTGVALFIADILLPLSYKLGPERARPYLYVVVFLPLVVLFGAYQFGLLDYVDLSWIDALPNAGILGVFATVPLVMLVGLGASFLISCRIMEKKEF